MEHTGATGEEHLDFHLWALSFFMSICSYVGSPVNTRQRYGLDLG